MIFGYINSSMDEDILEAKKLKKSVFERAYNDYETALSGLSTKQKQEYNDVNVVGVIAF